MCIRDRRKLRLGPPEALLSNSAIMAMGENGAEEADDHHKADTGADADTTGVEGEAATASEAAAVENNGLVEDSGEGVNKLGAYQLIANFLKEAKATGIYTVEEEIAELLEDASEWLSKAAGFIAHPSKLFVKKNFQELDRFIEDGVYLLRTAESPDFAQEGHIDDMTLLSDITTAWSSLVTDEKIRLEKLQLRRDQFKEWDEKVKEVVEEEEKRLSLDVLRDLLKQGTIYPQGKIVSFGIDA